MKLKMPNIPDRWLLYTAMGDPIPGTRFICFKVPLKQSLCSKLSDSERFTPEMLMTKCPKLGLVVDLTNTNRYYSDQVFKSKGIQYKKIYCPGRVIPTGVIVKEFFNTVDAFLKKSDKEDTLVGVHCTHGLNRTGYFICRYLNLRMGFAPQDAIAAFEQARGHKMEREHYIQDIVSGKEVDEESARPKEENWRVRDGPSSNRGKPHRHPDRRHFHSTAQDNRRQVSARRDDFYPPQPAAPRRDNLVYESPLSNSYEDYTTTSRYSRGYGSATNSRFVEKEGYQNYSRHNPYQNSSSHQKRGAWDSNNVNITNGDGASSRARGFVQMHNTNRARNHE